VQPRRLGDGDVAFLNQFAGERLHKRLTRLDATARQLPAGDVAVADEEDFVAIVDHQSAHAERHAA
jgi:hypothetical protein